jgi:hypothetical protein
MMLGLGILLVAAPRYLSQVWVSVILLSAAMGVTAIAARLTRGDRGSA